MSRKAWKTIAFALAPTAGAVVVFLLGLYAGRYLAVSPLRKLIASYSTSETLGRMLTASEERQSRALAYYDGQAAVEGMDQFSWAVPNVLTPFVGNGARPGQNDNAYINSMQFRADAEVARPKQGNVYRIFITGGSTAYGSGAPTQERTIGGYLKAVLNSELSPSTGKEYEVLVMANPAWASTHERIVIENRLSELDPDMVIAFSGNNDVHWGRLGRDILWFRSYADQYFWDVLNAAYKIAGYGSMPEITETAASPVPPTVVAERLEKNIRLSCAALSMSGARYVFILQPTISVSSKGLTVREQELLQRSTLPVREYFAQCYAEMQHRLAGLELNNLTYIDQSDVFHGLTAQDEVFLDSYHFGDRGNEIIAREIFGSILPIVHPASDGE